MRGQVNPIVLQSMLRKPAASVAEVPVTASRAMRLAVTRAAERAVGLQLTVSGVAEEILTLEGVQAALNDDLLLLKLLGPDDAIMGVLALDTAFIAAIVEVQTTGNVGPVSPESRSVTLADLILTQPFLDGLFAQLLKTTPNTALDQWTTDIRHADRFDAVRAIGLALAHVNYRMMKLTLDLGGEDRKGELILALPIGDAVLPVEPAKDTSADWATEMRATVFEAPAALTAVLHRFDLSLDKANSLQVGQVLALPGCTVSSLELVGADGVRVARAKLGQVAGHIAVRLEDPIAQPLKELPPRKAVAAPDAKLALPEGDAVQP